MLPSNEGFIILYLESGTIGAKALVPFALEQIIMSVFKAPGNIAIPSCSFQLRFDFSA